MNCKKVVAMMVAVAVAGFAMAEEAVAATADGNSAEEAEELEEEEESSFCIGFDNDLFTAYVWRNSVVSDRAVWQPCVWADWAFYDPFSVGFYVWQNWDFTHRRRPEMHRGMNETDFDVHFDVTAWQSDDEEMSLALQFGHVWYVNNVRDDYEKDYPTVNELFAKATFSNPLVDVYFQFSEAYHPSAACSFEGGLTREIELCDSLTLSGDWNLNFGSGKYLTDFLYGVGRNYNAAEDDFDSYLKNGIGGTTFKLALTWAVCDHFSLGLVGAYTAVLNGDVRSGLRDYGYPAAFRNLVWGGVQAKIEF